MPRPGAFPPSSASRWTRSSVDRPRAAGIAGTFGRWLSGAPLAIVLLTTLGVAATVAVTVFSSAASSRLSGELTAARRVRLLEVVMAARAREVDDAGRAIADAKPSGPAPRVETRSVRGAEVVKLAIAREAALAAELGLAMVTGLPQTLITLVVLGVEVVLGGTWIALAGAVLLFGVSRLAADRTSRRVARETQRMQQADVAIFSALGEALSSAEDLRLLGARGQVLAEFADAAYRAADARRAFASAFAVSGQIKSVFTAMAPVLILGALVVSNRTHGPGDVAALLLVVPLAMGRLEAVDALRSGLVERAPVLRATVKLLELPPFTPAPQEPERLPESGAATSRVSFEAVTFTPPGDAPRHGTGPRSRAWRAAPVRVPSPAVRRGDRSARARVPRPAPHFRDRHGRGLAEPGDVSGHGTACAGIIHRMAPAAEIVDVNALGPEGRCSRDALVAALRWCVHQRLSVVNMSLGIDVPRGAPLRPNEVRRRRGRGSAKPPRGVRALRGAARRARAGAQLARHPLRRLGALGAAEAMLEHAAELRPPDGRCRR